MSLETGTYISDLVVTNPASGDDAVDGDNHLRLIKSTIKATFPNISGAVTPTNTELNFVDGVTSSIQTQLDGRALVGPVETSLLTLSANKLVGRVAGATGALEEIAIGGGLEFTAPDTLQTSAFTGDVTKPAGSAVTTIANSAITSAMISAGAKATRANTQLGVETDTIVTPNSLAALWDKGSAITSSSTITIPSGGYFAISGNTTITSITYSNEAIGRRVLLKPNLAITFTHSASLICPGNVSLNASPDDEIEIICDSSGVVRIINVQRAGLPPPSNTIATTPTYMARAWVTFDGTGTPAITNSGNVASITDNGVGDYTITFTTAMPANSYSVAATALHGTQAAIVSVDSASTLACRIKVGSINLSTGAVAAYDSSRISVTFFI